MGDALKSSDFALEDFELQLIDYLEKNSYETELYVHDLDPASSGFHVASCILAPISAPSHYMYGINCDGKWMKIKGKLQLQDGIASKFITISGLNYSPIDGGWSVRYQDTNITRDVLDPNYYSNPLENIYQGVLAPITESFKVIRLHENQA